jgi:transposase
MKGGQVRFIGLDVHLDFCEIAISERGRVRSGGRVPSSPEGLRVLADSLAPDDHVALEVTGNALAIARRLEPHVARVVVAARKELRAISEAKVKTDRRDARTLARLLAAGLLDGCWLPDEKTRSLRRRLSRRAQLVRQRTRCKNEVHAVLMRNLKGRPPMSDLFGKSGRVWLGELELPGDERQTVDGCLRQIDFLDAEIAMLEKEIAQHALGSEDIRRLMTVPGVSLTTAATFIAAVGEIDRFPSPRKLVGYLGLDPKVRQSGREPARHGRISKQGDAQARQMLTEAAFVAVSTAGPMRAFYERVRARRGSQIAIVAVARKLAVLFWHMLTRQEDYAFARPSLTRHKLRELELRAGAERHPGSHSLKHRSGYHQRPNRERERELSLQAELAYRRLVSDWKAAGPAKVGAGATPGRASSRPSQRQAARQASKPQRPAL